jgi:hypothetical protein
MALSFEKFNYGLRPSKQVERKVLIEKLLRLSQIGFELRNYTYVGFGSVYYIDFIMVHKFLYMNKMICVEGSGRKKRMKFNKPYRSIKLEMKYFSEFVNSLSRKTKYIIWLDYDYPVNQSMLRDIDNCVSKLASGSIFLVTIECRARLEDDDPVSLLDQGKDEIERYLVKKYDQLLGKYVGRKLNPTDIDKAGVVSTFWQGVDARITESLAFREGLEYKQLFNFLYADGAPMMTIGGLIGSGDEISKLGQNQFFDEAWITNGSKPVEISVPPLTLKEKSWLDANISESLTIERLAFELEHEYLENYRKFYKEYPTFIEALM